MGLLRRSRPGSLAASTPDLRCGRQSEALCKLRRRELDEDAILRSGCHPAQAGRFLLESSILPLLDGLVSVATFLQECSRLSSRPNNVLKMVESASNTSPARSTLGGIHRNMLNSRLPASMNGCGRDMSTGCLASTWMDLVSSVVNA